MSDFTKLQVGVGLTLGFVGAVLAIAGMPFAGWAVFTLGLCLAIVVESLVVRLGGALLTSCLTLAMFSLVCAPEPDPVAGQSGRSSEPPSMVSEPLDAASFDGWPLTVPRGTLRCEAPSIISFSTEDGRTFQVNGAAAALYADISSIVQQDPETGRAAASAR